MAREDPLSRREREILDIVFAAGEATAAEVRARLPDPPSYSAVRGLIRVLETKGHLTHRREGVRNVYRPTRTHRAAGRNALARALQTFFGGDVEEAVLALVDVSRSALSAADRERLRELIEKARREGR